MLLKHKIIVNKGKNDGAAPSTSTFYYSKPL